MTIPILKPLRWTHNYKLRKKNMQKTWESWDSAVLLLPANSSNNFASHPIMPVFPHRDRSISILLWSWIQKKTRWTLWTNIWNLEDGFSIITLQNSLVLEAKKTIECFGSQRLSHSQISRGTMVKRSPGFVVGRVSKFLEAQEISNRPSQ